MALKTKVRLGQISGSIPTDSESAAASTSLALDDLGDILNHMASSIKRIHGAATFTSAASGAFSTSIFPASANGAALGADIRRGVFAAQPIRPTTHFSIGLERPMEK